jgi:hypothetical protein
MAAIAQAATLRQAVSFQESATYLLGSPIYIGNTGPVPRGIIGNGATLKATTLNAAQVISLSNPHSVQEQFFIEDIVLDANSLAYRALSVCGLQYAFLRRMRLFNATSICFGIDAGKGYGCYYNEFDGFQISGSAWMGLKWADNLADYASEGSHIQGNTCRNFNVARNQSNAWFRGVQGGFEGRLEWSKQVGLLIDNTIQLDLDGCYFENNMLNGVDTAVQVDDATSKNVVRRGGQWDGAVLGTVRVA